MERFVPTLVGGGDEVWECPRCRDTVTYLLAEGETCDTCKDATDRIAAQVARVEALTPKRFRGLEVEVTAIWEWVANVVEHGETEGLLIGGPSGPGKTGNAFAALRLAAEMGYSGSIDVQKAAELVTGMDLDEQRARVKHLQTVGLLLFDDLGAHINRKDWIEGVILRVVDARWEHQRPTIVTSNIGRPWLVGVDKHELGERVASRLASYHWVPMGSSDLAASDRRGPR